MLPVCFLDNDSCERNRPRYTPAGQDLAVANRKPSSESESASAQSPNHRSAPGPTWHGNPEASQRVLPRPSQSRSIIPQRPQPKCARAARRDPAETTRAIQQRNAAEPSPSAPDHRTCTLLSRLPRSHPHTSRQQPLSTSTRTNRSGRYIFGLGREPLPHSEADTAPRDRSESLLNRRDRSTGGRCF